MTAKAKNSSSAEEHCISGQHPECREGCMQQVDGWLEKPVLFMHSLDPRLMGT
jgi:hypothetical protein